MFKKCGARAKVLFCQLKLLIFWRYRRVVGSWVCLHGGGGPQVGEVTGLGGVPRLSI